MSGGLDSIEAHARGCPDVTIAVVQCTPRHPSQCRNTGTVIRPPTCLTRGGAQNISQSPFIDRHHYTLTLPNTLPYFYFVEFGTGIDLGDVYSSPPRIRRFLLSSGHPRSTASDFLGIHDYCQCLQPRRHARSRHHIPYTCTPQRYMQALPLMQENLALHACSSVYELLMHTTRGRGFSHCFMSYQRQCFTLHQPWKPWYNQSMPSRHSLPCKLTLLGFGHAETTDLIGYIARLAAQCKKIRLYTCFNFVMDRHLHTVILRSHYIFFMLLSAHLQELSSTLSRPNCTYLSGYDNGCTNRQGVPPSFSSLLPNQAMSLSIPQMPSEQPMFYLAVDMWGLWVLWALCRIYGYISMLIKRTPPHILFPSQLPRSRSCFLARFL